MDQPRGRDTWDGAVVNSSGKSPEVPSHLRYLGEGTRGSQEKGGWLDSIFERCQDFKETEIKTRDVHENVFCKLKKKKFRYIHLDLIVMATAFLGHTTSLPLCIQGASTQVSSKFPAHLNHLAETSFYVNSQNRPV